MIDYTPEGMLKRIEVLEEENKKLLTVFELQQSTIDNLVITQDNHNDRIGNLEHPDN